MDYKKLSVCLLMFFLVIGFTYATNTAPTITSHYITGDSLNNTDTAWTTISTCSDVDSDTCNIYNYYNTTGKDLILSIPLFNVKPNDISKNNYLLTPSGFSNINGVLGNSSIGDIYEPTATLGKYGEGFNFDGINDYISYSLNNNINSSTSCVWIKYGGGKSSSPGIIINNAKTSGTDEVLRLSIDNTTRSISLTNDYGLSIIDTNSININQWYYLCVVHSKGTTNSIKLYRNGVLSGIDTSILSMPNISISKLGGYITIGTTTYFNGSIDNYVFYPCNLTSLQINYSSISPISIDFSNSNGCLPKLSYQFNIYNNTYIKDSTLSINKNILGIYNKNSYSYYFDGINDKISTSYRLTNLGVNNITKPYTFFININNINKSGGTFNTFFANDGTGNNRSQRMYVDVDKKIKSMHFNNGINSDSLSSISLINDNTDYYITIKYDGKKRYIYINGILDNSLSSSMGYYGSYNYFSIGSAGVSNYFKGKLSNIELYNYSMSENQILEKYNSYNELRNNKLVSEETTINTYVTSKVISCDYSNCSNINYKYFYITNNTAPSVSISCSSNVLSLDTIITYLPMIITIIILAIIIGILATFNGYISLEGININNLLSILLSIILVSILVAIGYMILIRIC